VEEQVFHRFDVLGEQSHLQCLPFAMAGLDDCLWNVGECSQFLFTERTGSNDMPDERFATLLGHAAMDVWGDMPRDVQEALFETAMKGHAGEREALARLLHDRHPRTAHPARPD
jgi:hypothetical protein